MSSSLVGKTLGNYKVVDNLGQGGMASVFVGYQENVDRKVAIKVLSTAMGQNPSFVERFQLEARTIARLQHPHILPLYDYGQQDDMLYLVMAYIEGGTLEDVVERGPMSLGRVEKILKEVSTALDYAHRQGVIHRDIKPANILLDSEGHALLADFGIAKMTEQEGGGGNLTGTGVVGTPAYMAPEQAQGMPLDGRVDIYSLGVVVYEMLSGKQPFEGETIMQIMMKVMRDPPPNIVEVAEGLPLAIGAVMNKVLAKDPADRYQTATEFADALSLAIGSGEREKVATPINNVTLDDETTRFSPSKTDLPAGEKSTGTGQTVIVQQGISPAVLLGLIGIIAAAVIVVVLVVTGNQDDENPPPQETAVSAQATDSGVVAGDDATETAVAAAPTDEPSQTPEPEIPVFGDVSFSSGSSGVGNTLNLVVEDLASPSNGMVYAVYLLNTADGEALHAGELSLNAFGGGTLSFSGEEGVVLPAFYNALVITAEESPGDAPAGDVVYSAHIPVAIMQALREIFVESDDGLDGGSLLDGAMAEAGTAARHATLAVGSDDLAGVQTHSEHTVNILRGEEVDYNGNGRGENPGRGVGLFTFLDLMEATLDAGLEAADDPLALGFNAEPMRVCLLNTRHRAETLEGLARDLLDAESLDAVSVQLVEVPLVADVLQSGQDFNQNEKIDPFEDECGLEQMAEYGMLAGHMDLFEGGLDGAE